MPEGWPGIGVGAEACSGALAACVAGTVDDAGAWSGAGVTSDARPGAWAAAGSAARAAEGGA
jgi:hypothetical protein